MFFLAFSKLRNCSSASFSCSNSSKNSNYREPTVPRTSGGKLYFGRRQFCAIWIMLVTTAGSKYLSAIWVFYSRTCCWNRCCVPSPLFHALSPNRHSRITKPNWYTSTWSASSVGENCHKSLQCRGLQKHADEVTEFWKQRADICVDEMWKKLIRRFNWRRVGGECTPIELLWRKGWRAFSSTGGTAVRPWTCFSGVRI